MEERLLTDIRNLVKQQYYNCKILVCYTYEINGGPVYIVKMEDNKTIKTVKIFKDEIIDTENYFVPLRSYTDHNTRSFLFFSLTNGVW